MATTTAAAPAQARGPRRIRARPLAGLLITLACLLSCVSHADTSPLAAALRELDALPGLSGTASVQVLHVGYDVETRSRVTERLLGDIATSRCRMSYTPALGADFLFALHAAAPVVTTQEADLRWVALFLDRQGVPAHRFAVNGRYLVAGAGRLGYLDGIPVALEPGMAEWFERTLAVCLGRHE